MYNGGGEITNQGPSQASAPLNVQQLRRRVYVEIIEQPASKSLRFRYECEGRSAGSIPGASSTPENKTYPAIRVVGHRGRSVVVVSCVTKDKPYRAHPHNLVGREGCKKGVCTLEISPETMSVTFSNLGIQCVKKKDIESALRQREQIRVDPFREGFGHRNQPTSIDLNAVRLCFQVFLEDGDGKFTIPLTPVVSEPIYDKKAMSELAIVKLSDCVATVDGGRKDIILLCEKITRDDIQIRFYEEKDGQVVWEGFSDIQPSQVHKQTAIWFRPPRYRTLEVTEPIKVFIQLKRPSDGTTSEPLPFEFLPLDSGRPAFWSFRRNFAKKGNYNLYSTILANDAKLLAKRQFSNLPEVNPNSSNNESISIPKSTPMDITTVENISNAQTVPDIQQPELTMDADYSRLTMTTDVIEIKPINDEKSFNELIDQVTELDEIYQLTRARAPEMDDSFTKDADENFDDSKTYTSLQMAFKNPIEMLIHTTQQDTVAVIPLPPITDPATNLKRDTELEKLPPLPPKRSKKVTDICEPYIPNQGSTQNIQLTSKQAESLLKGSNQSLVVGSVSRSSSFNLHRPHSHSDLSPPSKKLPPKPTSTLPNPKKRNLFSKLFSRKKDKSPSRSREPSASPSKRNSLISSKSLLATDSTSKKGSTGNLSIHSNRSQTGSIHIPLKGPETDNSNSEVADELNQNKGLGMDLNANDDLNMDLTEAEHYALYTSIAPHATQKAGMLKRKRQKYENDPSSQLLTFQLHGQDKNKTYNQLLNIPMNPIKIEPRDGSPSPYGGQVLGSPMYAANPSPSPQHQYLVPNPSPSPQHQYLGPTPPPTNVAHMAFHNIPTPINIAPLPNIESWSIQEQPQQQQQQVVTNNLGGPSTSMSNDLPNGLSNFLDMDSHQLRQLYSSDLNLFDPNNLSENLTNNLSLSDVITERTENQNMTDSLTRLANNTLDSICQLNDMYKPQPM